MCPESLLGVNKKWAESTIKAVAGEGYRLLTPHFLRQNSTPARFPFHRDDNTIDERTHAIFTLVVLGNGAPSTVV